MKKLVDILDGIQVLKSTGSTDIEITDVVVDSRKVEDGSLFIAYKGYATDGHQYIESAITQGAKVIVLDNPDFIKSGDASYVLVSDAKKVSGKLASNYFDHPSTKMKVIGITGTNGKTSVASMLFNLFENMGKPSGLISTIEIKMGKERIVSTLTTPDSVSLQRCFFEMNKRQIEYVFMEVSSHALDQGRTDDVDFDIAVFTNISHDHLDYHETFSAYIKAKKKLFDTLKKEAKALVNIDDKNGEVMVQNCQAEICGYALYKMADYKAKVIGNDLTGLQMIINDVELYLRLIGKFNAYNALATYGVADLLGLDSAEVMRQLSTLDSAEGRMDVIQGKESGIIGVVDYAHTPDALEKVLVNLSELTQSPSKLITVVGCGGNRDKAKRPKMGKIAVKYSDLIIITSDNPRDEDPEEIIDDMFAGIEKDKRKSVLRNSNREEAIKTACAMAHKGDIILVAGKGHEKYQEIKGQRFPFDDKKYLNALLH